MVSLLYFITFGIGLAIIYTIVLFAVYNWGGWQMLELRFKATRSFRDKLKIGTIALGNNRYKNSVKLAVNKEGLYVKPMFNLIFHKALFIRWADVEYAEIGSQIMGKYLELKLEGYKFKIGLNYFIWEEMQALGVDLPISSK
jgi:hypothetical protein